MGDFRKLKAWEMAHRIVISIYRETAGFPADERYGLVAQMRRAAVSIAANIAEGCGRNRGAEMAQFIRIALGSCTELEYHILLSCELRMLDSGAATTLTGLTTELRAMLASLHRKLTAPNLRADS